VTDPALRLKLGEADFTQGRSTFRDHLEALREPTAKVYIPILVGAFKPIVLAQLDTGAAWSVLDPVVARSLGLLHAGGLLTRLETRFGAQEGRLVRVPIQFIADHGTALDTEATFFISPDWPPGRTFLGYSGLLDAMRFAIDPQANHFYFGP
jgi:hypothetical protein